MISPDERSSCLFLSPNVDEETLASHRSALSAKGFPVAAVYRLENGNSTVAQVREVVASGIDRIVVCGGDGTVGRVVRGVMAVPRTKIPLGILPGGTGNDFARSLGVVAEDPERALEVATGDFLKELDVAWAGDAPFINAITVGFGAEATRDTPPVLKRLVKGLSYSLMTTWKAFVADPFELSLEGGGFTWRGRAISLTICNGAFVGGGVRAGVEASPCDGRLDAAILPAVDFGEVTGVVEDWIRKDAALFKHVVYGQFETAVLRCDRDVAISIDGEVTSGQELRFSVSPRAVRFAANPAGESYVP